MRYFFSVVIIVFYSLDSIANIDTFRVSEILRDSVKNIPIDSAYRELNNKSDTLVFNFYLLNDVNKKAEFFLIEHLNEYIHCKCEDILTHKIYQFSTGISIKSVDEYDYHELPTTLIALEKNDSLKCTMKVYNGTGWRISEMYFFKKEFYHNYLKTYRKNNTSSNTVIAVYLSIALFNLIILFVLYYNTKNRIFGFYALYLLSHIVYGLYLVDMHSWIGSLYPRNFYYSNLGTETIIFITQSLYIYFVYLWLEIGAKYPQYKKYFIRAIIIMLSYIVFLHVICYSKLIFGSLSKFIGAMRLISLIIQIVLLYIIIFKVKSKLKFYIIAGSLCLGVFGVLFSAGSRYGLFQGLKFDELSTGAWYMIGTILETLFFSIGIAYYYYSIQNENKELQVEKLEAVNEKLNDRIRISQDLHDQIGSTLSSIAVYSQVAIIQDKSGNENLKNVLDKISDASNNMTTEISDIVWAIHPKNDSIIKIIERMESFAKPLAMARNIDLNITYENEVLSIPLTMDQRKNFYLIFKEAINNAIKYSAAKMINVNLYFEDKYLYLIVKDNGIGFNLENEKNNIENLSGNGLNNMNARAKAIDGELSIETELEKGTTVKLSFQV